MIMATELLNQRIKDVMCLRSSYGYADPTPTLVDIERTHLLFVNAHFKPFAAIGFEYNKVGSNTGTAAFGSEVQFSLPQFGDFFSDMVLNAQISQAQCTASATSLTAQVLATTGLVVTAGAPTVVYCTALANGANNIVTKEVQLVNQAGTDISTDTTSSYVDYVRWCDYPGQRLLKQTSFNVNGNPLDSYTANAYVFHQKFRVAPNKLVGWKRLVGQETPVDALSDLMVIGGTSQYSMYTSATGINKTADGAVITASPALGSVSLDAPLPTVTPTPASMPTSGGSARKIQQVLCGFQTPQLIQPALDLWIPLIFWFNKDVRLAIPSVSIPYGQRFITFQFETLANMLYSAPGNVFARTLYNEYITVTTAVAMLAGNTPAANYVLISGSSTTADVTAINRYITVTPQLLGSALNTPTIPTVYLYINNIFVNPEIHDIYIKRIGFSLIRVHREQLASVANATDSILMSQLKWPIETLFVGIRPTANTTASAPLTQTQPTSPWRDWHRMSRLTNQVLSSTTKLLVSPYATAEAGLPEIADGLISALDQITAPAENLTYTTSQRTIDTLSIVVHAIVVFTAVDAKFFSSYLPYTFGGANINTPDDEGALMVNFCLHPGTYQPSGHINVSRCREFYVNYTSSYLGVADAGLGALGTGTLVVLGVAINFLLISDGNAVLRYST